MKKIIIACLPVFLTACIPFPVSQDTSAHTVGKGNWGTAVGVSQIDTAYVRQTYGVDANNDVGLIAEAQRHGGVAGISAKHAFLNQERGYSFAVDGTAGYSFFKSTDDLFGDHTTTKSHGPFFTLGPILSYRTEYLDSFASVHANVFRLKSRETYENEPHLEHSHASDVMGTASIGSTLWFNQHIGLMGSANLLFDNEMAEPFLTVGFSFKY
jgi:hypothetical protein